MATKLLFRKLLLMLECIDNIEKTDALYWLSICETVIHIS